MAKFIEIFVIAIFLVNSSHGEVLNCEYLFYDDDGYNCKMTTAYDEPTEVTSISGDHRIGRETTSVNTLYIPSSSNTNYIPTNFCSFFVNLTKIDLYSKNVVEINKDIFDGCTKLESIYFRYLNISTIDEDFFSNLTTLKEVSISNSNIETLPKNLFKNNPNLASIVLSANKLKVIEIELTQEQKNKMKKFVAYENICINDGFRSDDIRSPSLSSVLKDITEKCKAKSNADNEKSTTEIPREDPQEQRIVIIERKIDDLNNERRTIVDKIQTTLFSINVKIELNNLKVKALSSDTEQLKKFVDSNVTAELTKTRNDYETLFQSINKVNEKTRSMEVKLDDNLNLKDENEELRTNISHNKNLVIATFCIQIFTVAFAIFISVYFKIYSRSSGESVTNDSMRYGGRN